MNFDEKDILSLIDDAANFGVELFVLDDGWFGDKYPRDKADSGLGDWVVNKRSYLMVSVIWLIMLSIKVCGLEFGLNPKW